jgi:acetyl-CoA acetyltransferase
MAEAYVIDALRTPVGRRGGGPSETMCEGGGQANVTIIERLG